MNKYWKLIIIGIVIILSIGTFYIKSALTVSKYPEFVIEKQSGDESEVDNVVINGNYYARSTIGESLTLTSNGSKYKSEQSFLKQLDGYGGIASIRQLKEKHRNFMRGKSGSPDHFYEDEHYLVYGEVDYQVNSLSPRDFRFSISVLDKVEDKTNSFEIDVPDVKELDYMNVDDVQMMDGKLKIFTKNVTGGNEAVHLYSLDIASEKIVDHKEVISNEGLLENQSGQIMILSETNPMQKHQNVLFEKSVIEDVEQSEGYYVSEEVSSELVAYNLETDESHPIALPEKIHASEQRTMFDDSTIYFVEESPNDVVVTPYLLNEGIKGEFKFTLRDSKNNDASVEESKTITINNGKVYAVTMMMDAKKAAVLVVGSLKTGKTLYTGEIIPKDPLKDEIDSSLYVTDIQIN
ncbi:hypothetical protein [Virgibacillus ndiopensis]|uniref:hypothetical protein n=1 Tax=Virgibacillus ndiopensis TaxID=2004408 RepID=UPI000C07C853|nr:hypothetical protein [Virgibacillus ndiopensis]